VSADHDFGPAALYFYLYPRLAVVISLAAKILRESRFLNPPMNTGFLGRLKRRSLSMRQPRLSPAFGKGPPPAAARLHQKKFNLLLGCAVTNRRHLLRLTQLAQARQSNESASRSHGHQSAIPVLLLKRATLVQQHWFDEMFNQNVAREFDPRSLAKDSNLSLLLESLYALAPPTSAKTICLFGRNACQETLLGDYALPAL
jgi:hypothetical protein